MNTLIRNLRIMTRTSDRLLGSLVVECWLRVRKVPGSIPSQGPRHTKDVIKILVLFQNLRQENNVMDKIWYRSPSKSEAIGRCGGDDHAEPTTVER